MLRSVFRSSSFLITFTIFFYMPHSSSAQDYTMDEVYQSAVEKGKSCANYWVQRDPSNTDYYADICSFYGVCIFGDALEDNSYYEKINSKYRRTKAILTDNIDHCSCGILPLHLYVHNNNEQQLNLGLAAIKGNMQRQGFVRNAIDDTYMTGSLHIQAYKATQDTQYLDFATNYLTMYMGNLQQESGLYWHHKDLSHQFWGRGNGWGAASSAELLRIIPKDHEKYDVFIDHYKKHMQGLVDAQWDSGMWPQLLLSKDGRNWEESSGTAMFVFALFTGLEMGILDAETFLEPAMNGWMALKDHLRSDGRLNDIAGGFWPRVGDANEYLNANRAEAGNSHGTAGFMWAVTAIVRYHNMIVSTKKPLPYIHESATNTTQSISQLKVFDLKGRTRAFSINNVPASLSTGMYIHRKNNTSKRSLTIVP